MFSVTIPGGSPPVVLLAIKDTSGNAVNATPSTPSGSWSRYSSGAYDALWIGTKLPSTSYSITVTNSVSTNQGAIALPLFGVTPTVSGAQTQTTTFGAVNSIELPTSPFPQSPAHESLVILSLTVNTSAGYLGTGISGGPPGLLSMIPLGPYNGPTGFLSAVVLPAGGPYQLEAQVVWLTATTAGAFTANSIVIS